MSDPEGALQEETPPPPPYIIFVVVFLFFVTGLCGFLVCHMLKLKGYRCTMEDDEDDDEELEEEPDDDNEENQDTVEQILKCIIENEANMEAFNEMLGKGNVCVRHDTRLRKESIGGLPPHLHTVHSGTDLHNTCHLCAQSRSKRGRRPSRTPRFRQRPGEQTVFSVGRFRVTHEKKSADSGGRVPDVLVSSGDCLDQSQDSEERRDSGYNLRNMFKDVRSPSESTNNVAPKRRRSLTLFGLRRGSDPIGVKVVGTGREGVRFIPQPVVLEEPHNENGENGSKAVSKLRGESLEITTSRNKASPAASAIKTQMKSSITVESSTQGTNLQSKDVPGPVTSPPDSLPMPVTISPQSTSSQAVGKETDQQAQLSPGPLQTSTPLSPLPDPGEIIVQFAAEASVPQGLPGSQTPPDPCTSPVLEHDSFDSPALISLGSSPHSSRRTPTSPLLVTPSPKFSTKVSLLSGSSPKLLSSQPSGSPMRSLDRSMASLPTSSPSASLHDDALPLETISQEPSLKSSSQTKLEGSTTKRSMPELTNLGIVDGDESSPQLSPSLPVGGRVGSVTIVKASPDSKREFSVVTMVEEQMGASKADLEEPVGDGGAELKWTLGDEKEEMVEMEEISECRVTQVGEVRTEEKTNR